MTTYDVLEYILNRDGQSQGQRFPEALSPLFAKLDEKTRKDLLEFAAKYAKLLKYYDTETNQENGDWSSLFEAVSGEDITRLKGYGGHDPHIALYMSFILLLRHAQRHMNSIPGRHLDFYYRDTLRFTNVGAVSDKLHALFELKKNIPNQLVKAGTLLKAGKDTEGKELLYATTEDIIVNTSKVLELRSVYHGMDSSGSQNSNGLIHMAPMTNSKDGLGEELDTDEPKWSPFGHAGHPAANIGFALASPVLLMSEGVRTVTVDLTLPVLKYSATNSFSVYLTGENGLIGPLSVTIKTNGGKLGQYKFEVVLEKECDPVVRYSPEIHGGSFRTDFPLMQIMPDNDEAYQSLSNAVLSNAKISVEVKDIGNLSIANDLGKLDPSKPFMPFGPAPETGSQFYFRLDELVGKEMTKLLLKATWNINSDNLSEYYPYIGNVSNKDFTAKQIAKDFKGEVELFNNDATDKVELSIDPNKADKKGSFTLRLNSTFYHKEYRQEYTRAIVEYAKNGGTLNLPREPYTPLMQSLTLQYEATSEDTSLSSDDMNELHNSELEFFHITAFGHRREHAALKGRLDFIDEPVYLLPRYGNAGELYIGLSGIGPSQNLSLLIQAAEGSANPEKDKAEVQWSILCDNHWRPVEDNELLVDTTNGLLTSGIVKVAFPREATDGNTLLPSGLYWLRASVEKDTDAVCQLIDVKPNAVIAEFTDRDNAPSHLRRPLPAGTISKAKEAIPGIKSIAQPYSSFGGKMAEDDDSLYTRASERLRHKHRSVTAWDYERIILERFPSIYKVKCLNHTSRDSKRMPGNVTIIAVPDLKNRNAVNPLQPKVDKNTLVEIETCLKKLSSMFVRFNVQNPEYERIEIHLTVKFLTGFEFGYYKNELIQDIKRFLSPWAYEQGRDIAFGGTIHRSVIVDYIEELPYVDYLLSIGMVHFVGEDECGWRAADEVSPSDPRAILVSSDNHYIEEA